MNCADSFSSCFITCYGKLVTLGSFFAINFVTIITDVKHHLQFYFPFVYIEKLLLINLFKVAIANWSTSDCDF